MVNDKPLTPIDSSGPIISTCERCGFKKALPVELVDWHEQYLKEVKYKEHLRTTLNKAWFKLYQFGVFEL